MSRARTRAIAAAGVTLAALIGPAPGFSATFDVTTTADGQDLLLTDGVCDTNNSVGDGPCTLRAAVSQSNFDTGLDTVNVPAGTYTLDEPPLEPSDELSVVDTDIVINGAGAESTVIRQDAPARVLEFGSGAQAVTADVNGVTIRDGVLASVGAGVLVGGENWSVALRDSIVTNNQAVAGNGGGIWNIGSLVIERSRIAANSTTLAALGGGIYNDDEADLLRIVDSTISGNTADDTGAGGGPVAGGGVFIDGGPGVDGPVEIVRSTISGNRLTGSGVGLGGGIFNDGELSLVSTTLVANSGSEGANLFADEGEVTITNSLLAASLGGGANCGGQDQPISGGHNLDDGSSCGLVGTGDLAGVDPLLAPLGANGGPTATHALTPGSPAIDAGRAPTGETADQRGLPRPADFGTIPNAADGSDIGAFELQPPPPPPVPTCKGKPATIVAVAKRTPGTGRGDVIVGRLGKDRIAAKGGKDLVCARGGNDEVKGGAGKDRLFGQAGKDELAGGGGNDDLRGGGKRDELKGGGGTDRCKGGGGKDRLKACEKGR